MKTSSSEKSRWAFLSESGNFTSKLSCCGLWAGRNAAFLRTSCTDGILDGFLFLGLESLLDLVICFLLYLAEIDELVSLDELLFLDFLRLLLLLVDLPLNFEFFRVLLIGVLKNSVSFDSSKYPLGS